MLKIFIGYDKRQPLGYNVLQHSIARHSSQPVSITPLILDQLPIKRRATTEFTFSRFLVPYLCDYKGHALFLDADMVVTGDIAELFSGCDHMDEMVRVNQKQAHFEWSSAMLFNCYRCRNLTPEYIDNENNDPYEFNWAAEVGNFPKEWNHCVGYAEPNEDAKLFHYTQGLPCWEESSGLDEDHHWNTEYECMNFTVGWDELLGKSKHAPAVLQRMMRRYKLFRNIKITQET